MSSLLAENTVKKKKMFALQDQIETAPPCC